MQYKCKLSSVLCHSDLKKRQFWRNVLETLIVTGELGYLCICLILGLVFLDYLLDVRVSLCKTICLFLGLVFARLRVF